MSKEKLFLYLWVVQMLRDETDDPKIREDAEKLVAHIQGYINGIEKRS